MGNNWGQTEGHEKLEGRARVSLEVEEQKIHPQGWI